MNPCDSKRFYDTEFEATIAAAKMSYKWDAELEPYRCGTHWHLANTDRNLRSKHRKFARMFCDVCNCYMKRGRWARHITTARHIKLTRKKETS